MPAPTTATRPRGVGTGALHRVVRARRTRPARLGRGRTTARSAMLSVVKTSRRAWATEAWPSSGRALSLGTRAQRHAKARALLRSARPAPGLVITSVACAPPARDEQRREAACAQMMMQVALWRVSSARFYRRCSRAKWRHANAAASSNAQRSCGDDPGAWRRAAEWCVAMRAYAVRRPADLLRPPQVRHTRRQLGARRRRCRV